jgi:hypothetical protein
MAFVLPWVLLWEEVLREPVTAGLAWISNEFEFAMTKLGEIGYALFVQPWIDLWNNVLREPVTTMIGWIQETWASLGVFFTDNVVTPIANAWTTLTEFLPQAMDSVKESIVNVFTSIGTTIKSILTSIVGGIIGVVNRVINEINFLASKANEISAKVNGPQLPMLPKFEIPQFAEGGVVTGPTLAMVGEGSETEYIVPQSKASGFAANWMDGKRGAAAIPGFANGGMVMPSGATSRSAESSGMMSSNAQISIQTGPVMQMNGQNYVTTQDLSRAVQSGVQQTINMMRNDRGTRRAAGLP